MKKRVSALVLALALLFSVSAAAATPRSKNPIDYVTSFTVNSSGAHCGVTITAYNVSVSVSGTVTLYKDGKYLTSWSVSSTSFSKTYTKNITSGLYSMEYDLTVKGPYGTDSISGSVDYNY